MFQINNKGVSRTVGRFLKLVIKATGCYLPEVTAGGVLQKMCPEILQEIHLKTPVSEPFLLIKLQGYSCFPVFQHTSCLQLY